MPADLGPVVAVDAGGLHTCAARRGAMVSLSDLEGTIMGSAMCRQIWDLLWQLAVCILVQCGAMVSSSALEGTIMGSAMCRQTWDLLWQLAQAVCILVQCGAMVSSSALEGIALARAMGQQIWDVVLSVASGPDHTRSSLSDDEPSRFPEQ